MDCSYSGIKNDVRRKPDQINTEIRCKIDGILGMKTSLLSCFLESATTVLYIDKINYTI